MRYVVSVYRPGYLPEAEPYSTEDLAEAIAVWRDEIAESVDGIADEDAFLHAHTALHIADLDTKARDELYHYSCALYYAGGYAHTISAEED